MKKIFTLFAVAAMALTASAQTIVNLDFGGAEGELAANTVIASDDNLKATTAFNATIGATSYSYKVNDSDENPTVFPNWIQLRVANEPSQDNPYGTDNGGSTSIVVDVKKAMNLTAYVRTGNNKEVKLFHGTSFEKVESERGGVADGSSNQLWICTWKNLNPGTYVITEKGGTGRLSGLSYTLNDSSAITDIAADENAPVEYFNLQGMRVENPANGLFIKRQGNKVTKVIM